MLHKKITFYLALAGITSGGLLVHLHADKPVAPKPFTEPARSPFELAIAATGIIEASRENIRIGTFKQGVVSTLFVNVGDTVDQGQPLFQLDGREAAAKIKTLESGIVSAEQSLEVEKVGVADAEDQFIRASKLEAENVSSKDERLRKEFVLNSRRTMVKKLEADIIAAQAQLSLARTELELLTVKAPRAGRILQLNIREGEFAALNPDSPLMILGDVERLQVRADVDEQNAHLVKTNQIAHGYIKGNADQSFALQFIRIEPYVVPKKALTGDSSERVDTRVLQVIFEVQQSPTQLYVGQQVDVFIKEEPDFTKDGIRKLAKR